MGCPICAHAAREGCWPPVHRGTHCRRCHRSWTALGQAHCPVCCGHFATAGTLAFHWSGRMGGYDARHLDPRTVSALVEDADGVWHRAGERPPVELAEAV